MFIHFSLRSSRSVSRRRGAAMRLSGLQTDVLILYKALLKSAVAKSAQKGADTAAGTKSDLYNLVRKEFREKATSIPKNDFRTIEHLLRYGYKQKKLIDMPGFSSASVVRK